MSEEIASKHRAPNIHGSCSAIFSSSPWSSPVSFNKENKPPAAPVHVSTPDLTATSTIKNGTRKRIGEFWAESCGGVESSRFSRESKSANMMRSKSTSTLQKENSSLSLKATSDDKSRTPRKSSSKVSASSDKTPVTHFCTPRRINGTRNNGNSTTPMKRYFSDRVLSHTTPECFNTVQMETPRGKQDAIGLEEQTVCEGENSNLTVGVRVRPLNFKELNDPKISMIVEVNGQNISVACDSSQHTFMYDHCFVSHSDPQKPGHADQAVVFESMVLPLVHNAFEGYNVCLLAYGQTGSGKSHSMMGTDCVQTSASELSPEAGIIPRFCREIFSRSAQERDTTTSVEISYFEIYNEKIHDLLASSSSSAGTKRAPLKVREHPVFGPYVVDLSQHSVQSYADLQAWLQVGNSQRVTAATGMNEKSSRSHSIFSIVLTQTRKERPDERKAMEPSRRSKINLVDLAGSERLSQTCASGDRLREGVSINKSLLILGKVIASLAESTSNRKRGFVPYRESVLTWLLKESLGGNSRTAMLATVSPGSIHLEETLATLRYACQARAIVNRVRINEDPHDKLIRELKAEVLRLRGVKEVYDKQLGAPPRRLIAVDSEAPANDKTEEIKRKQREIDTLRDQLKRTEEQLADTQKSALEKLRDAEVKKNTELKFLRCCGIAVEIDYREKRTQPCLVNLTADPILSGALLYLIPPGTVRIGKRNGRSANEQLDIVLDGPLVRELHCTVENKNGKLMLSPEMNGDTYVNGQIVTGKILLKHGDRLVIGGNHYFKVCNPHDNQKNKSIVADQPIDFEFAHQEILTIQEEKLRAELEESKQKAIKELENAKREIEMQLGSQKSSYEHEIKVLGSTLETQKLALESINRQKKELEIEKEELALQLEKNNRLKQIMPDVSKIQPVTPYKSNFLEELQALLFETTADAETALRIKQSNDAIKAGGVTLHEMQLLVREATERCRDVGVNYEFYQQQMIIDKSLQPVIRVRDRDRGMETFWQPMHFLDWIHRLRDHEIEDSMRDLRNTVDDWESYEESDIVQDSLNNSRISVNMTPVKKQLNESLHHLSMDNSILERTEANETTESTMQARRNEITKCLEEMQRAAKTLSRLCHEHESRETSGQVTKSLDKVRTIIDGLKTTLEIKNSGDINDDSEASNSSACNNTVIQNSEISAISDANTSARYFVTPKTSPSSSPRRAKCPFSRDPQTPKTVRFDFK